MNESRSLDRRDIWLSLSTAIGAIDMSESQLLSYWLREMTLKFPIARGMPMIVMHSRIPVAM